MSSEREQLAAADADYDADTRAWEAATEAERDGWAQYFAEHPGRSRRMKDMPEPDGPAVYFARQRAAARKRPWLDHVADWEIRQQTAPRSSDMRRKPPEGKR